MPELPEVEAARRAIEENCIGKKIVKAIIADDQKVIDSVSPYDFESSLLHKTILSARRKGKNLWLVLDSPPFPSFQFGMAGAIYIKGVAVTKYKRSAVKDTDEWPSKYSKLFIELDDGMEVSFTDKRRFAKVRLLKDPALVPPISELGPDALLELMPVDDFHQSLSKKKVSIKTLLLDQGFISGIGNWIADEVLYQARLHPQQIASSLSKESCATLLKCIKEVIQCAVQVDAESHHFPLEWLFHFRWGKKPGKVNGKTIDFITAGGRTTAYVPELQKLSGDQIAKVAGKPRKQAPKRKRGGDEDNESDNGDEDAAIADEPSSEEGDAGKKADSKKEVKPRGRGKKPPPKRKSQPSDSDNGDENAAAADEALSEEGDTGKKADSKKEVKPRGRGKKPPPKRKSQPSDSDNGDKDAAAADEASSEEGDTGKKADSKKEVKPRGRGKKPAPKRKSQPSDSDNEDDDDNVDADDDNVQTKEAGRVKTNNKQTKAAVAPKKKATSQKKKGN